jgi:hypothetical protein
MRVSAIGKYGADIGKKNGAIPPHNRDVTSGITNYFRLTPFHVDAFAFARGRPIGQRAWFGMPDK